MVHLAQQRQRQAPRLRRRVSLFFRRCDHGLGVRFAFNCPYCDPGSTVATVNAVATAAVDTGEHRTLSPEWRDQILP